jgi:hypothetical protein
MHPSMCGCVPGSVGWTFCLRFPVHSFASLRADRSMLYITGHRPAQVLYHDRCVDGTTASGVGLSIHGMPAPRSPGAA